ncbi:hypothetical protein D3C79_749280 [compost metagenome]
MHAGRGCTWLRQYVPSLAGTSGSPGSAGRPVARPGALRCHAGNPPVPPAKAPPAPVQRSAPRLLLDRPRPGPRRSASPCPGVAESRCRSTGSANGATGVAGLAPVSGPDTAGQTLRPAPTPANHCRPASAAAMHLPPGPAPPGRPEFPHGGRNRPAPGCRAPWPQPGPVPRPPAGYRWPKPAR